MKRTVNGVVDHLCDMMEQVNEDEDMSLEKKIALTTQTSKEVRGYMSMGLAFKKLMIQAPDVARADVNMTLGSGAPKSLENGQPA